MKTMRNSMRSNSVPSSIHPKRTTTDMEATEELVIEKTKQIQIQQFITDIKAEIQKTATLNIDTYLADDTTSLKDVVLNMETTSARFKSQYIELVAFVSDTAISSLFIKLSNNIHHLLITTLKDFERANLSQKQGIAKMQLYTFANSHYEQLIRMSEMLLLYID